MEQNKAPRFLKLIRWRIIVIALLVLSFWAVNALIYYSVTDLSITYLEALITDIPPELLAWQLVVTLILIAFAGHETWRIYKEHKMGTRLELSEDKYKTTFEKTDEFVMEADAEGTIISANPAAVRMLRYDSPAELIGKPIVELYSEPQHRDKIYRHLAEKGSLDNIDITFKCKDGSTVCGLGSILAHKYDDGNVIGTHGFFTDITERKKMEGNLHKLELAVEQSVDGIAIFDEERRISFANDAFARMHGYEPSEVVGMQVRDFFFEDRKDEHTSNRKKLHSKGSVIVEVVHRCKDGSPIPTLWSATLVKDGDGNEIGSVAVAKDITERKQMEQQLKDYSLNLEKKVDARAKDLKVTQEKLVRSEKLAAIGQLASGIAHDLRSPLAVINNIAYYLKLKLPDADEKVTQYLDMLEKEVSISKNIINDLLDFVRVKEPKPSVTTVEAILSQMLKRIDVPGNVEVKCDVPAGLPDLMVDSDQLERVFINIVENAMHAMPGGGRLDISSTTEDHCVIVKVTDSGDGIAKDHIGKVFEPLFTTRDETGGTGIGLAICKSIVEAHRGTIKVESKADEGTTFIVKLPVKDAMVW